MARPEKLTPEVQKAIVTAIELGATYDLAARYAGITYQTFCNWMTAAETAKTGKFVEFAEGVAEAEGRAVVGWLEKIEQAAGNGNWQAAAWKLERRYPHSYGRQVQELQHSGTVGIAVTEIEVMLTPEKSES